MMFYLLFIRGVIFPGQHEHIKADIRHKDHRIWDERGPCHGYLSPDELDSEDCGNIYKMDW